MFSGTNDLSDQSIRDSSLAMIKRAFSAAPMHVIPMLYVIYSTPELRDSRYAWIAFGMICFFMMTRGIQYFYLGHLTMTREKLKLWRILFALNVIPVGISWGLICALSLHFVGLKTSTIALFALISAVSAGSVASFSFDLVVQFAFQFCLFAPVVFSAFLLKDENSHALAVGEFLFFLFMLITGRSMFRFQRELLKNSELVSKQKEVLDKTHGSLAEAYRTMGAMLESIDEAFLTFDAQGICSGQNSDKSKSILGFDPSGRHIAEVLGVEPEDREDLASWYEYLYSGHSPFDIMIESAPKTMKAWKGNRSLKLSYHPMRFANGAIRAIIMTAIDVTKEVAAEARATEARDRAELILRVHENPMGFRSMIESYMKMLEKMRNWNNDDLVLLRREMHNLKGAMMSFGARRTSSRIYEGELLIKKLSPESAGNYIRSLGEQLHNYYVQWRALESKLISQINLFDEEVVKISKRTLFAIEKRASRDSASKAIAQEIIQSVLSYELGDQIEDYRFHVEETALKLGKKVVLRINRPSYPVFIDKPTYEALRTIVHIFNNSIDHGIEKSEDRLKAGKREYGLIQVSYSLRPDGRIHLVIEDDGRGINLAKLRQDDDATNRISDFEVVSRVFVDGKSTAEQVTAVSGQGIGMGAVKSAIEARNGKIRVLKTSRTGTAFEIVLSELEVKPQAA